jgi:hypothetical protein
MILFNGIQTFIEEAGEAGCYALDIMKLAERITSAKFDPLEQLRNCINRGLIYYNEKDQNDNKNFFVEDPAGILVLLTGRKWEVTKEEPGYVPRPGEYIVERWERSKTGAVIGHFRLPDWDSLADSQTVKYGKRVSLRVFRRVA